MHKKRYETPADYKIFRIIVFKTMDSVLVLKININIITLTFEMMPIDPVCGIEMDQELAIIHSHKNKTYYFCCDGCKRIFARKPHKYSK